MVRMPARWVHRIPLAGVILAVFVLGRLSVGCCQINGDWDGSDRVRSISNRVMNLSGGFVNEASKKLRFCIKDWEKDWNGAFDFSANSGFLEKCMEETRGDLPQRLCTAAEMNSYLSSFYDDGVGSKYLRPNKNCNLTSWVSGCEPGWSCSASKDQNISLQDSKDIPFRTLNCHPCCQGFFCPYGLTCMIPCPLGAYCPLATLNKTTGICDPYKYPLPPGKPNHTCGGADRWADVGSSGEIFCPAGYYCPSTIEKFSCSSGHYCRKGSTSEIRCYIKSSCKSNSASQNITLFGALLVVALSLLLLIIYNFSGQIITIHKRQQAKSREAAARMARETVQARERWKKAKEIAKTHAAVVRNSLSHTFSRRRSLEQQEELKSLSQSQPSSAASTSENSEPDNVIKMMHSLEEYSDSEGFSLEIKDKNFKKNMPRGEEKHSRTQIFKYAYGQIEKEKAVQQQMNMTFSGLVSVVTANKIRTRPMIEVAFRDLTLSLKGKQLLRCVTGKLMPGRVTAVMGPSGAGKTTFLYALTGRTTGYDMTGLVLINGKVEPIRAYEKIIGFVPQDDVVHGNLTVEENLWFSARCRLSADMPKADKVLVVERVIEYLGLQAVRDSLVGTVEKRGISGGQRKRVSVGLEMVIEPSLLILDEPTSGLDSSSSQLLLRALRREALEGVNICMVVHQPSYTLFKMFDDLILLAKGGLTVYHGAVEKAEEYFANLGINVPERVNPPDYYIDILEGVTKPDTSIAVTCKELPLRWMLHNRCEILPDMQHNLGGVDTSARGGGTKSSRDGSDGQPFVGEACGDANAALTLKQYHMANKFSKLKDLSNRRTPGILVQYKYYLGRVMKQRLREARIQVIDFLILGLAGVCLGMIAKVRDETFGVQGYMYTVISVSLLCKIGALRSFSLDKLQYSRERASGMSLLAYFLSKDTIDHFNTAIKPITYLSMFYFVNNPRSSIADNYTILVALVYCVTGTGYIFAICFQPGSAQLWSALLPVVLTLIATRQKSSKLLSDLCYPKWALEAFEIASAQRYSGVWLITRCGVLKRSGYDINDWTLCMAILVLYGVVSRFIAFLCLLIFQRK